MPRGWVHSGFNVHRGRRDKRAAEEAQAPGPGVRIIDLSAAGHAQAGVSEHEPRRIPSAKWREPIKKVWKANPLMSPKCRNEMRIVALIDEREVIERILRHLGLWEQGVRVTPARAPASGECVVEPCPDDPFPDYENEPVMGCANEQALPAGAVCHRKVSPHGIEAVSHSIAGFTQPI